MVWNSEGTGGLSILEFPKARGGLDEDATRGKVWIFSGITHSLLILKLQMVTVTQFEWAPRPPPPGCKQPWISVNIHGIGIHACIQQSEVL